MTLQIEPKPDNSPVLDKPVKRQTAQTGLKPRGWWLLLLPSVLLVGGFFVVPLFWLVRLSFSSQPRGGASRFYDPDSFTFSQYQELLGDPYYSKIFLGTFEQAALITLTVMLLAYPCAWVIHRGGERFKGLGLLAVMLPKLTNLLVLTYGLLVLLSNSGVINQTLLSLGIIKEPLPMFANLFAVVAAETVIIAPYPILILISLFERLDPALEQAAQGMGAHPLRAFYEVGFKLTLPGALVATFVTFIWAFGAYIGPVIMGNPENYTAAVEVFSATIEHSNWPLGAALATANIGLIVALFLIFGSVRYFFSRKP